MRQSWSRGITTWCRQTPTSIQSSRTRRTPLCSESLGPISANSRAGLDRRDLHNASRCADVHILGLQAKPLGSRCRPSHRSFTAKPESCKTAGRSRCRSRGQRVRRRERSRTRVGRAARCAGQASEVCSAFERAGAAGKISETHDVQRSFSDSHYWPSTGVSIRPSLLSRSAENNSGAGRQACRCYPRFCEDIRPRLYRDEQPRAVLVAWDTLEIPTLSA